MKYGERGRPVENYGKKEQKEWLDNTLPDPHPCTAGNKEEEHTCSIQYVFINPSHRAFLFGQNISVFLALEKIAQPVVWYMEFALILWHSALGRVYSICAYAQYFAVTCNLKGIYSFYNKNDDNSYKDTGSLLITKVAFRIN